MVQRARPAVVRIVAGASSGSGVIVDAQGQNGYVVTNYHVVKGQSQVDVVVNDSVTYKGSVLGTDGVRDLAVVRICCGYFHTLPFGNASTLRAGDEVVAVGYALGLPGQATITRGIVSAVRYDPRHLSNVIQTDAAINPGNSGGPMLSMSGKILGINTFGYDQTRSGRPVEGLSFAISEQTVRQQLPTLRVSAPAPTQAPTRRPTATPSQTYRAGFGPVSGELQHNPRNDLIEAQYAKVSFADMIVEATFVNPYSGTMSSWDYGFTLRDNNTTGLFINIVVTSNRQWSAKWGGKSPDHRYQIGEGTIPTLNTGAGGTNHLRVVAIKERGWFFVNDQFVSTLDLSAVKGSGGVAVTTGNFTRNEVVGAITWFENFQGQQLNRRYGPASGKLEKKPGEIGVHNSGVQTRDMVVEAEFINPQGIDRDYGFIIRTPTNKRLEAIGLDRQERWFHYSRDVHDNDYTVTADGYLLGAKARPSSRNHLLLIAIEEFGWFFVNDQLVSKLRLSHNLDVGWVSTMGNFFGEHQSSLNFENFNVWTP